MIRASLLAVGVAALALAACGRVGPLDQPAPLYGAKAKADYRAKQAAAAAAKTTKDQDKPEPLAPDTPGLNDPAAAQPTLHSDPPAGMLPPASTPGPPDLLPDPYNRPQ